MLKGVAMINDKRTILKGATALVVNIEDMDELEDEPPEQIVVLYAPTNADLTELLFQRSGKDGD